MIFKKRYRFLIKQDALFNLKNLKKAQLLQYFLSLPENFDSISKQFDGQNIPNFKIKQEAHGATSLT